MCLHWPFQALLRARPACYFIGMKHTSTAAPVAHAVHAPLAVPVRAAGQQLSLSPRSVWRLIALKELDTCRCGRAMRITQESIDDFVKRGGTAQ